jgi:hypothetical protein
LHSFAAFELFEAPSPAAGDASEPHRKWRIDKEHRVALAIKPNLKKERRVDDQSRGGVRCCRELDAPELLDAGMHDFLDGTAVAWRSEYGTRKRSAIDEPIGGTDTGSKQCLNTRTNVWLRQHTTRKIVAHAHLAAKFGKDARDLALAAADTSNKSDDRAKPVHARRIRGVRVARTLRADQLSKSSASP